MTETKTLPDVILDRSTLENYIKCPAMGYMMETDETLRDETAPMVSGTEAHGVIAGALRSYAEGGMPASEVSNWIEVEAAKIERTDVQPDVITALRKSKWEIQETCKSHNKADFMHIQGSNKLNPQLACELLPADPYRGRIVITSEFDLVLAGNATTVEEIDWKTGNAEWTRPKVRDSFQFRMHAWLLFDRYPNYDTVETRVRNTRSGEWTPAYSFKREWAYEVHSRMVMACRHRDEAFELDELRLQGGDSWILNLTYQPLLDNCVWCPVLKAGMCGFANNDAKRFHGNEAEFIMQTELKKLEAQGREKLQKLAVKEGGAIDLGDGRWYGPMPPKKPRVIVGLYEGGG
tara:strand:+ start:1383 stop:2426 length:1044 start_codon:yes stop_codon:yes gene_type:complete